MSHDLFSSSHPFSGFTSAADEIHTKISFFFSGAIYKDDCPVQRLIPIYLIVSGSCYLVKNLIDLCIRYKSSDEEEQHGHTPMNSFSRLLGCFLFGFFIAGNIINL